jgi:hypothetical protein
MKAFSKRGKAASFGIAALAAAIVLTFTACDQFSEWTFENWTRADIEVSSEDLDPSSFTLDKYPGTVAELALAGIGDNPYVSTKSATSKKSKLTYTYKIKGADAITTENNITATQEGSTATYERKPRSHYNVATPDGE